MQASGTEILSEARARLPIPALARSDWEDRFPWLAHGVTGVEFGDLGWRGPAPAGEVMERWDALLALPGIRSVVHARQVHGAAVRFHRDLPRGLLLAPPCDGHLTDEPGILLAVSVADCVPIFIVSETPRAVAVLHAGWRGAAAGILEAGLAAFRDRLDVPPEELHLHLGPAISGEMYEVGAEVHVALGAEDPGGAALLDLRARIAERAIVAGVLPGRIGISTRCTQRDPALFSHRGGSLERQMAVIGIRDER